VTRLDGDQPFT